MTFKDTSWSPMILLRWSTIFSTLLFMSSTFGYLKCYNSFRLSTKDRVNYSFFSSDLSTPFRTFSKLKVIFRRVRFGNPTLTDVSPRFRLLRTLNTETFWGKSTRNLEVATARLLSLRLMLHFMPKVTTWCGDLQALLFTVVKNGSERQLLLKKIENRWWAFSASSNKRRENKSEFLLDLNVRIMVNKFENGRDSHKICVEETTDFQNPLWFPFHKSPSSKRVRLSSRKRQHSKAYGSPFAKNSPLIFLKNDQRTSMKKTLFVSWRCFWKS